MIGGMPAMVPEMSQPAPVTAKKGGEDLSE